MSSVSVTRAPSHALSLAAFAPRSDTSPVLVQVVITHCVSLPSASVLLAFTPHSSHSTLICFLITEGCVYGRISCYHVLNGTISQAYALYIVHAGGQSNICHIHACRIRTANDRSLTSPAPLSSPLVTGANAHLGWNASTHLH